MKKEEKELLLKDLCGRLPYGVKCNVGDNKPYTLSKIEVDSLNGHLLDFNEMKDGLNIQVYLSEVKPYLFPLSSMTEEQKEEFYKFFEEGITESANETKQWLRTKRADETRRPITIAYIMVHELVIEWLNKNHFDYRGLIKKGLAIDASNLNIYQL